MIQGQLSSHLIPGWSHGWKLYTWLDVLSFFNWILRQCIDHSLWRKNISFNCSTTKKVTKFYKYKHGKVSMYKTLYSQMLKIQTITLLTSIVSYDQCSYPRYALHTYLCFFFFFLGGVISLLFSSSGICLASLMAKSYTYKWQMKYNSNNFRVSFSPDDWTTKWTSEQLI